MTGQNSIPGLSAICEDASVSRFHNFKERKKIASLGDWRTSERERERERERVGLIGRYQRRDFIPAFGGSAKHR